VGPRLALGISIVWLPLAFLTDGVTVLLLPVRLSGGERAASVIDLVSFAGLAAAVIAQPIAGLLSDRVRNRLDRRTFLAMAAIPALAGIWLIAGSAVGSVALGYLIVQVATSAMQAAQQTLIPEHVGRALRGRAAGLKAAFDIGGSFVAFLVLGALLAYNSPIFAAAAISATHRFGRRRSRVRPESGGRIPLGAPR
jgi:MFS family permease